MTELTDILMRLADGVLAHLATYAAVFSRMSAVAFFFPGIGEAFMPVRIRLAAVVAVTMIVAPAAPPIAGAMQSAADWATLICSEVMIGLAIGFAFRLAVFALQMTGTIAAQHLQMSQLFGPGIGHDQESTLSQILLMAGLALAAAANLHAMLAAALLQSYAAMPPDAPIDPAPFAEWAAQAGGAAVKLAFALAAPFVILGVAYSIALAAMNKAMPNLMASFIGAPAILFAGLALFAGAASVILGRWSGVLATLVADPFEVIR